jgi:hypothetical protein
MNTYYVSLTHDLIGVYLEFQAESESAVRRYLESEYLSKGGVWKLPWCAVYTKRPTRSVIGEPIIFKAAGVPVIYEEAHLG